MGRDFNDRARGKSDEEIRAAVDSAEPFKPNGADHNTSRALFWPELRNLPRPRSIVKGVVDLGVFGEIFGPTGSGKSFLAGDMGLHVALAWKWFGRKVRQGGVLYVSAEGGAAIINRLRAFAQHHQIALDDVPFGVVLAPTNLLDADGAESKNAQAARASRPCNRPSTNILSPMSDI
jgi:AAA domain